MALSQDLPSSFFLWAVICRVEAADDGGHGSAQHTSVRDGERRAGGSWRKLEEES